MKKIFLFLFVLFAFSLQAQDKKVLTAQVSANPESVKPGDVIKVTFKIKIEDEWHINSHKPLEDFLEATALTANLPKGFQLVKINYPAGKELTLGFSDSPVSVYEKTTVFTAEIKVNEKAANGKYKLGLNLYYQACNNQSCMAPADLLESVTVEVKGSDVAEQTPADTVTQSVTAAGDKSDSTKTAIAPVVQQPAEKNAIEEHGMFIGLILIFGLGLALNLTPCVYPLIPITIGYFGGQSEGKTSRLFMLGLLFVLGMSLTYSVVGVVTALSGAMFGALLQNTYVIVGISLIFILLALSMFGLYEIQMPMALVNMAGGAKGGLYGSFFMGLTMGIVAAPCIGPIVLSLVTYVAAKQDPLLGFIIFFVLSLGLGFPYLILAIFSGKIKKLPRAGEWMESVKHIFGLMMIAMAIYFVLPIIGNKEVRGFLLPLFFIVSGIYLILFEKKAANIKGFTYFKHSLAILLIIVGSFFATGHYNDLKGGSEEVKWTQYSGGELPVNYTDKKGLILDFYADWCIPCKELDEVTFKDPAVKEAFKDLHRIKVDLTKSQGPNMELKNKFGVIGVPTVIVLNSEGKEVDRIVSFVKPERILEMIDKLKK